MLVRLVLVPGVIVFMLLRATCVVVLVRVFVFVFHELPPSSRIRRSQHPRGEGEPFGRVAGVYIPSYATASIYFFSKIAMYWLPLT